jgi:hypothetical protein
VCSARSNACNPLAARIDKNLGNPHGEKGVGPYAYGSGGYEFYLSTSPFFGCRCWGASQFTSFGFASNFVLDLIYRLFANT